MILSDSITTTPIPFDTEKAAGVFAEYADLPPNLTALLAGTAGCSPFLSDLITRESEWLRKAAALSVEQSLNSILDDIGGDSFEALSTSLRQAKRRTALLTALCDLGGIWSLEQVTNALTRLADRAVNTAITHLVSAERSRGKLPDGPAHGGLVALAMGKMGANELNYSSDIDLIMLFDESIYPRGKYQEIRKVFVRVTQRLVKLLSDTAPGGYVFRTDLRLRPDPSVTPVCIGIAAAERYYESQGRTWERAAMIKARPCAGDIAAGELFLSTLSPFIWRRHLDFAAIQDAHDMRLRIREHKGLAGQFQLPGHDVKLGRGGIREIEFFTQTQQLICGGRDPDLRNRGTLPALQALTDKGWVTESIRNDLTAAYIQHRILEHRLQMINDAQTHIYPASESARRQVACLCAEENFDAFEGRTSARFKHVSKLTETFFAPEAEETTGNQDHWSEFPNPEQARILAESWHSLPALRTERAAQIFRRIEPKLVRRLERALNPVEALVHLDTFLRGLPAGVQVFSLFEANPQLLDLLVDICAIAPELAQYLGRNAAVLDAVINPDFYSPLPSAGELTSSLKQTLAPLEDYERVLDATRIWAREHKFRVGVQLLRQISSPDEAATAYSALAEAVLAALLPLVIQNHARRFGPPPGRGIAVIGMGKLGSSEMTATSDLDLIVIYDAEPDAISTGSKPLAAGAYYARLTQALISALTVPTAQGTLYEVDMRLRPSGRQGPVATNLAGFIRYQKEDAWTWEHLALTRARVIAGGTAVKTSVSDAIAEVVSASYDAGKVIQDTAEMQDRLRRAHSSQAQDPWSVKDGPGRMLEIELFLQAGALLNGLQTCKSPKAMISGLSKIGWLTAADGQRLKSALQLYMSVQQISRLATGSGFEAVKAGRGLRHLMCSVTDTGDLDGLEAALKNGAQTARDIMERGYQIP